MFPILADFLSTLGGGGVEGRYGIVHSATVSPVPALSLPYWPGLLYRPVLLAQPSPVPYRPGRVVMSPTLHPGPPVPACPASGLPSPVPTCPVALLPAHSSFLAVPAWAHGEEPYSYPVPARHALYSLPIPAACPIHHKQLIT
jgi:hypothetical protein